jgi:purine-nucleoside phosphorylase
MSTHIGAKQGAIAETILLPGDPMRAKFVAENLLKDAVRYNEVRGMYGFTGTYNGKRVSVQGTGMGIPSISIYATELIKEYGVKRLVRIGSCGGMRPDLKLRDIIMATAASTDSSFNKLKFNGADYAAAASITLMKKAYEASEKLGIPLTVGPVLSTDTFYGDDPDFWKIWSSYGVLAAEMETAALYTIAAKYGVDALALLTVSDNIVTGELTTSEEREKTFVNMMRIALELA